MAGEAGMFTVTQTIGSVLCCRCGISMAPNAANMCVTCLRSEVDITEGLQKNVIITHCPECDSYLQPPRTWLKAEQESKELLTFCVKRLKNLNKVRLVHAEFIWTEPHSRRLKVKLRVQKEVLNGAILEQSFVVDYVVHDQMCESCSRVQANPDQWIAAVQLRQHVSHRRTFFYLEQLILKHDAAVKAIRIKQMEHGIDFFFGSRSHALKFVEFIGKVAPIKSRNDKQLVSQDSKSNNYNYKYTFSVEICAICREDLICLPPKVAASFGNIGPLVICTKVSNMIPLNAGQYWRTAFVSLLSSRQLVEYIVLDVEPLSSEVNVAGSKCVLVDAQIAHVSDFGKNDIIFNVKTHLGHILNPGDYALGYDLYGANNNDIKLDGYKGINIPDEILIKKSYEEKRQKSRQKPRSWKENEGNSDIYVEGQTGLVGVNSKQLAQDLAEDYCPLSIEKKKEAWEEEIKIMTPEQNKEYERSTLRSSEEDANFKSSAKGKQPLDNEDAKELDDTSDSYSKGQTSLMDLYFKPTDCPQEWKRQFFAWQAHAYDKLQKDEKCPLAVERKKEARKAREARQESIKKMTPEQYQEYEISIERKIISKRKNVVIREQVLNLMF